MKQELYKNKDKMKQEIRKIWEEVLLVDGIGDLDNYFLLGGNSLTAIKILKRVQELLNQEIPLSYVFSFPTIEKFVEALWTVKDLGMKRISYSNMSSSKDLKEEISLELPTVIYQYKKEAQNCLLTGSTGYLGSYLIRELLINSNMQIYCLVRGKTSEEAEKRIQINLAKFNISALDLKRIHIVLGDLCKPNMGIEMNIYEDLAEKIDCIYHNGAWVNFLYTYKELKITNVIGTQQVLHFSTIKKIKPVYYVSTISIFSKFGKNSKKILEDEDISDSGILPIGYTQSKWVAEGLVWEAKKRGIPVIVFRLGHVVGDSCSGECNSGDFIFRVLKSCLEVGAYPDIHGKIEPIAVDDAAKVIVGISQNPNNLGQVFHLINPKSVYFSEAVKWAKEMNIFLEPLTRKQWVEEVKKMQDESVILPFIHFFDDQLWKVSKDLEISVINTQRALKEIGISIQPISQTLFRKYFNYLKDKGEIKIENNYTIGTL